MTASATADDRLREARLRLIEQGLVAQPQPIGVRAPIERSWRRSIGMQAEAAAGAGRFLDEVDPDSPLLRAASPVLDHWLQSLSGMRVALFLSDRTGQIVARRVTESADQRRLDRALAAEGFDFSEATLGTNGLGTPMEERVPTFVLGSEHFNETLSQLACAGAPIFHPVSGRVMGSLAFASPADAASPLMLSMAQQAAREIQAQLAETEDSRGFATTAAYLRRRSASAPVVVLSADSILANVRGLPYISGDAHAVLWERLRGMDWSDGSALIDLPDSPQQALVHRLDTTDTGAVFALEVRPQRATPRPGAIERSKPSGLVEPARLDAAAATGAICLEGPGGAGKRHLAVTWLTARTGVAPLVLDAAVDLRGTAWLDDAAAAVAGGRGVVVTHLEDLPHGAGNRIKALAASATSKAEASPRVVLTLDATACPPHARALVAQVATTAHVPALAAIRERIPGLARALVDRHPEAARIAFEPPAMQALLRWGWPGNLAELRTLVDALVAERPGAVVQLDDLPAHLRHRPERELSTIEALERDAIVAALRDADGNRSVAARALGLGRTTLYRKLRAFGLEADAGMAAH